MADWVLVVDDDSSNLCMASHILDGQQMRVSCLKSGEAALHDPETPDPPSAGRLHACADELYCGHHPVSGTREPSRENYISKR